MIFLALTATGLALLAAGFIAGLYANRPFRRGLPEHPTLRTGTTHQRQLRLVHSPYDWQRESEGA